MRLFFTVPDTPQTQNGVLLRNFLRQCAVSTDLARAVKFRGSGFFADGVPILANRRVEAGQVISFELPPEQRKPAPFALLDIMERYGLRPGELLMVDDLKPGYDMARAAGVDFAAAGWAYDVPEIEAFMRKNCDFYFKTVQEFGTFLEED